MGFITSLKLCFVGGKEAGAVGNAAMGVDAHMDKATGAGGRLNGSRLLGDQNDGQMGVAGWIGTDTIS